MNERIRELWRQAVLNNTKTPMNFQDAADEFALLIIRECANHCDLLLDHKISSEWSRGTHDCSRAIKKHFGVEE